MKIKTLAIFAAAAALAASARGEQVTAEPDALLDYIEATGSQYIDTGVNAETGLKAIIDFAWADEDLSGVDWSLLDACTEASSSDNRSRFFMCHMLYGKPYFGYGKQRKNPAGAVPFVRGERCEIITDMSSTNSLELIQDGVKTFDDDDRETFATNENENVNLHLDLFVFATNYGGAPKWYGKGKLYELKIFKKNATTDEFDLVRHYIPCIKDDRAGLYDKENGTISFSFGSTQFIAGSVTALQLADNADNSAAIAKCNGITIPVTLQGRTLYKDGDWNTLCLPFNVVVGSGQMSDATAMTLNSAQSGFDSGTGILTLDFDEVPSGNTITAGTPFIVKWTGSNLDDPVFSNVTVSSIAAGSVTSADGAVSFVGSYSPVSIPGEDSSKLFLSAQSKLYYPNAAMTIGSCRAYFQLGNSITVGDGPYAIQGFRLNFGDATGIASPQPSPEGKGDWSSLLEEGTREADWNDLSGRRLDAAPTAPGIYIKDGKKIIVK